jgi:hypothetical protein
MIDLYCERCGPGLLAEPINVTTNLAFLVAAFAAWLIARRLGAFSTGIAVLIALSVTVGVGSALFHTLATPWAKALDLVPILAFQLVFLWLYLRLCVGSPSTTSTGLVSAYLVVCLLMMGVPPYLNGSILYAPTFLVLVGLASYHLRSGQPGQWLLVGAAVVFCAAIVFRSIDDLVCPYFPIGTHFLWHLLNGALLYLAMRTLILKRAALSVAGLDARPLTSADPAPR